MAYTPPGAGTFTAIHFVLIALLTIATLLVIVAGVRRAAKRRAAERQVHEEAAEAGVPVAEVAPPPPELRDAPLPSQALDRSAFTPAFDARPVPDNADTASVVDEAPPERAVPDERIATGSPQSTALRGASAAAPLDASPATIADPTPAPVPAGPTEPGPADGPVTQLKGLGPKVAARLAELGITSVGQIAALDADQAQELDNRLGPFAGRLHRDRWVEQARFLAAGDKAGFEAVFGRL